MVDTKKREKELIKRRYIADKPKKKTLAQKLRGIFPKKKAKSSIRKTTADILPYKGTIGSDALIEFKDGFVEVLLLEGYNFAGMGESLWDVLYDYEMLIKLYVAPFKMITIHTPINTTEQQRYYLKLAEQTTDPNRKKLLMENFYEMRYFAEHEQNKEFYIFLYGDTVKELLEARADFLRYCGTLKIKRISLNRKKSVFFRLNNPTSTLFFERERR